MTWEEDFAELVWHTELLCYPIDTPTPWLNPVIFSYAGRKDFWAVAFLSLFR